MAEKKPEFQVVDKRKFTSEGEVRPDTPETTEAPREEASAPAGEKHATVEVEKHAIPEAPPTHSADDHAAGRQAYAAANQGMDSALKAAGVQEFEVTFERFITQMFMTALYQMGMLREEDAPARVDLVGARQTIDTIEMLAEKTKNNVTATEAAFLRDRLYELHMAYLEVTQAIARASDANARPPQG